MPPLYGDSHESAQCGGFARLTAAHGASWIDATDWVSDDECFLDGHHLLKNGAILFTERLTQECRTELSGKAP